MLSVRSKHVHMCVRRAAQKLLANHKKTAFGCRPKNPQRSWTNGWKRQLWTIKGMAQTLQNSFITTSKNEPSKPLKQNPFYSQLRNLRSPRSKLLHDYSKKERRIDRNGCRPTWIQGKGVQCTVGKKISFSKMYGNF